MNHKKEGTKKLESLSKVEIETLVNATSFKKIAKIFSISDSSARRILYEKIEEFGIIIRKNDESNYIPDQVAFSQNEMDYGGTRYKTHALITREGIVEFKGNSPIYKQLNQLSQVVKNYVTVMLRNDEPLKFINQ